MDERTKKWWTELSTDEQEVLIHMVFNMNVSDMIPLGVDIDDDGNYIHRRAEQ